MKKSAPACRIEGARTHNLKAVHCEIPFGKLTAVTGVSGSGKSTLAFDVLYAEGQRRFVDCLSTYARQFLQRLDRPDVDRIGEIQPPIALKQQVSIRNARSTVGSITELSDLLHLLFAHGGTPHCPKDGTELVLHTAESAAAELRTLGASRKFVLTASVQLPSQRSPRARNAKGVAKGEGKGEVKGDAKREGKGKVPTTGGLAAAVALGYQEQGYSRVYRDGEVQEWQEPYRGGENHLVVDRFTSRSLSRSRALEAIESAWKLASGRADVWELGDTKPLTTLTEGLSCPNCHERTRPLRPQLFSPNSPLGACPECNGFGRIVILDRDKVVPDGSLSLDNGAVVPFETKTGRLFRRAMLAEAKARGIPTDVPFRELSEAEKDWVFEGTPLEKKSRSRSKSGTSSGEDPRTNLGTKSEAKLGTKSDYTSAAAKTRATGRRYRGVEGLFKKLERKRYRPHVRIFLARFRGYETCPRCRGSRLHPVALSVTVGGLDLAQMEQMPVAGLLSFLDHLDLGTERTARVRLVLDEIRERLRYLDEVGLGYLMLARTARTLSGGETQRIRLASGLGTSLTETLYVLDEPTVGLHAADTARMLEILRHLCASGNTAVVVEHDPGIVLHADHLIVLGPSGGEGGGEIVYEGSTKEFVRRHPDFFRVGGAVNATKAGTTGSITTARSTTETTATATATATTSTSAAATTAPIRFRGIQQHNLVIDALDLPTDRLVVVTGVSGSGKSTLIEDVLYRNALRQFGKPVEDIGRVRELTGLEPFAEVLLVSQNPLGRSSRSTLISYTGLLASVRKRLAATPRATELGLRPGDFSFNVPGGRCETCKGMGSILLEMHFMADVEVTCEVCKGKRFREDVLEVTHGGRSILQFLDLTVTEALDVFHDDRDAVRRLTPLVDVGLGYLRLGQSTSTLSGGEAQRLKLASLLAEGQPKETRSMDPTGGRRVFLFDEPTSGLHPQDIQKLLVALRGLLAIGHAVVVVEHQLDFIASCDWIVDLGPGGGAEGGRLLYSGLLEGIVDVPESITGRLLDSTLSDPQPTSSCPSPRGSPSHGV